MYFRKPKKEAERENSVIPVFSCIMTVNKSMNIRWILYVVRLNVLRISYKFGLNISKENSI
jgi:hypothetical protein